MGVARFSTLVRDFGCAGHFEILASGCARGSCISVTRGAIGGRRCSGLIRRRTAARAARGSRICSRRNTGHLPCDLDLMAYEHAQVIVVTHELVLIPGALSKKENPARRGTRQTSF